MSTPENQNPSAPSSNDVNVTPPADATAVPAPKPSLSLKPVAPAAVAPVVAAATPDTAVAAAPVAAAPVAAAPIAAAPKPKLNLNVAPRSTASDLNTAASAQKIPDRKYAAVTEDDDQPSIVITIIAGLAAAAAITFAVLLFLKTK